MKKVINIQEQRQAEIRIRPAVDQREHDPNSKALSYMFLNFNSQVTGS